MNKIALFLIAFLLLGSNSVFSQENDWQTSSFHGRKVDGKVSKTEGSITFMVDSVTGMTERNNIVEKTKKYITQNLELIDEPMFTDSILLMLAHDKEAIDKLEGASISYVKGEEGAPVNMMMCAYTEGRDAIKGEMMRMIVKLQWGLPKELALRWLIEGLATLADPDMDTCDGHTVEERYVYFLQNDKLFGENILFQFVNVDTVPQLKIAQNQSAYIVEYLLKKDGSEKMKSLWQGGMSSFEGIYGSPFEEVVATINKELTKKYPKPIAFNWEAFSKECFLASIYADWHPLYLNYIPMESKVEGNIRYTVLLSMSMDMREEAIAKTGEYISDNLALINESEFNDNFHLVLVHNRGEMEKYFGGKIGGMASLKSEYEGDNENSIYCVYGGEYSPLKHELMHMINMCKWGWGSDIRIQPAWLVEGLAVFSNPEVYSCDGHTLEERYVYFLQTGKLQTVDGLMQFPETKDVFENKRDYNQSGYIIQFLYENYGMEKIKLLWIGGMREFESIYDMKFEKMIEIIDNELNQKYSNPIDFNWEVFENSCIE